MFLRVGRVEFVLLFTLSCMCQLPWADIAINWCLIQRVENIAEKRIDDVVYRRNLDRLDVVKLDYIKF